MKTASKFKKTPLPIWIGALALVFAIVGCTKSDDDDDNGGSGDNWNTTFINGKLPGLFSVSPTQQIHFSQGNLQYQASTNTWRFAEHQWDYVGGTDHGGNHFGNVDGSSNNSISPTYTGWIDLFGWGTSGWDYGNTYFRPWDTAIYGEEYGPIGNNDLTDSYAHSDWGVHNKISNGGNQAGLWRTLTWDEWVYVINTRQASTVGGTANARFAKATVNGIAGVIWFPDVYSHPTYLPIPLQINNGNINFDVNSYSGDAWTAMEDLGCGFLPAAGIRYGTSVSDVGSYGGYWSASCNESSYAYSLYFFDRFLGTGNRLNRYTGRAVRLVCPAGN